jgi:hypothetical protein
MGNKTAFLFEKGIEQRSVWLCSNTDHCLKSVSKKPYQSRN